MTHEYVHFSTDDFRSFWKDRSSMGRIYYLYLTHFGKMYKKVYIFEKSEYNVLGIGLMDEEAWS